MTSLAQALSTATMNARQRSGGIGAVAVIHYDNQWFAAANHPLRRPRRNDIHPAVAAVQKRILNSFDFLSMPDQRRKKVYRRHLTHCAEPLAISKVYRHIDRTDVIIDELDSWLGLDADMFAQYASVGGMPKKNCVICLRMAALLGIHSEPPADFNRRFLAAKTRKAGLR